MLKEKISESFAQLIMGTLIGAFLIFLINLAITEGIKENPRTILNIKNKSLQGQTYYFKTDVQIEKSGEVVEETFESDNPNAYTQGQCIKVSYKDGLAWVALFLLFLFCICLVWVGVSLLSIIHNFYLLYNE